MFGMSAGEIALVLVIALMVVGPKNLPKAARSLGRAYGWARHHLAIMQREINMELRRLELEEVEKKAGPNKTPRTEASTDVDEKPPEKPEEQPEGSEHYDVDEEIEGSEPRTDEQESPSVKVLRDLPPGMGIPAKKKETAGAGEDSEP